MQTQTQQPTHHRSGNAAKRALAGALVLLLGACASTGTDGNTPPPPAPPASQAEAAQVPAAAVPAAASQQAGVSASAAQEGVSPPVLAGKPPAQWNAQEKKLAARVMERRQALIAGDWGKAYSYMAPSYRALITEKQYTGKISGGAARQTRAEVLGIACETQNKCDVRLEVGVIVALAIRMGEIKQGIDETWIYENGNWWKFESI